MKVLWESVVVKIPGPQIGHWLAWSCLMNSSGSDRDPDPVLKNAPATVSGVAIISIS